MESIIRTYPLEAGKILRAQIVKADSFDSLCFVRPSYDPASFHQIVSLYQDHIIKKYGTFFGKIVLFTTDDQQRSLLLKDPEIYDPLAALTKELREHIFYSKDRICFKDGNTEKIFHELQEEEQLFIARGKRKKVSFVPVGKECGYLSKSFSDVPLAVNSSFFLMDQWDHVSVFDHAGIPLGLMIEKGKILSPPQFDREAFLLKNDSSILIRKVSLRQIKVKIGDTIFEHGKNCRFYERPYSHKTPPGKTNLVICANKLVGIFPQGGNIVPSGGFIIQPDEDVRIDKDMIVSYSGFEDVRFGLQVGNSVMIDGIPTDHFVSSFYRFYVPFAVSYPPSLYPLNFRKDRAPRILFGSDKEKHPIFIWIEGAGKFGHKAGEESEGASLAESIMVAKDAGMYNGIHLDGGGSAQLLLHGERSLRLSDRDPDSYAQIERSIPMALIYR